MGHSLATSPRGFIGDAPIAVLVVAAHPDDEVLGCGGTIAKHVGQGHLVHVVFATEGVASRKDARDEDTSIRLNAVKRAQVVLGTASITYLGFPDNRMDSVPLLEITQALEAVIAAVKPQLIYTHHIGDLNVDHRLCCQAVMTACRPLPGSSVKNIYAFEIMSSTEWSIPGLAPFIPNHFTDISDHIEQKILALEAYGIEMREAPHSRSYQHLRALAQHRGQTVGVESAEAFVILRSVA